MFRHWFWCTNWCIMYMCMLFLSLSYDSFSPVYILSYSLLWSSHGRLKAPGWCSLFVKCATLYLILPYLVLSYLILYYLIVSWISLHITSQKYFRFLTSTQCVCNNTPPSDVSVHRPTWKYWIELVAMELVWIDFTLQIRIVCNGVSVFVTECLW